METLDPNVFGMIVPDEDGNLSHVPLETLNSFMNEVIENAEQKVRSVRKTSNESFVKSIEAAKSDIKKYEQDTLVSQLENTRNAYNDVLAHAGRHREARLNDLKKCKNKSPPPPPRPPPPKGSRRSNRQRRQEKKRQKAAARSPPPSSSSKKKRKRGKCFARDTQCIMADGTIRYIQDIEVGDNIKTGGSVTAVMRLDATDVAMYNIKGVKISGDHALKNGDVFVRADVHPDAVPTSDVDELFNVNTELHRIVVMSNSGPIVCADYEETDDTDNDLDTYLDIMNAEEKVIGII